MAGKNVLVVDDDENILELVAYNLLRAGYSVDTADNGEAAINKVRSRQPDLVLLDLMLPGIDGFDVCRTLKSDDATRGIPVIMLTARGEEADIVTGLELGADDYIPKPFSPRVLLARVKAVIRRRGRNEVDEQASITHGEITVTPGRHEVLVAGEPVELTRTEFQILLFLARRPGWVFTRYQIVDGAQGDDASVTDRSVDVHIVSLRRKLGDCGQYIETVRGVGYRFKDMQ